MKCFYTGIELKRDEAYLLDIGEARRILQELRNKAESVENLIKEMGEIDVVEITSREGKKIKQRRKWLVCKQLAETFYWKIRHKVFQNYSIKREVIFRLRCSGDGGLYFHRIGPF